MSSDLRILVLGGNDDITAVGNALLGREVFDKEKTVYQRHSVTLGDKRQLHVTCATGGQWYMKDDELCLSDELVTEINTTVYHAVVFTMEIKPDLILWYPRAAECMLRDSCWKDFLRKKGVIVVREAKTVNEAQSARKITGCFLGWVERKGGVEGFKSTGENTGCFLSCMKGQVSVVQCKSTGKITDSFLDWMKRRVGVEGSIFQEVQERCALFDTSGTLDVLAKQRDDLVHMIDTRILIGEHYTEIKFQESQLRSVELEKQLTESIKDRKQLETSLDKAEKRFGGLETQLGEQAEKTEKKIDIEATD